MDDVSAKCEVNCISCGEQLGVIVRQLKYGQNENDLLIFGFQVQMNSAAHHFAYFNLSAYAAWRIFCAKHYVFGTYSDEDISLGVFLFQHFLLLTA